MRHIPRCLESIFAQSAQYDEFYILDNGSTDGTVHYIRTAAPHARIVKANGNSGFAAAHNRIIRETKSHYILVMNQDVFMERDYCRKLMAALDICSRAGSASGMLIRTDSLDAALADGPIDSCGISINVAHHASLTFQGKSSRALTGIFSVFGVSATCALYRRDALDDCAFEWHGESQYFDELFFMYKEDVDLSYRMRLRGWDSLCVADARCWHVRSTRGNFIMNRPRRDICRWSYRNHWFFLITCVPNALFYFCGIPIVAYELMKLIYSAMREPFALRSIPAIFRMRKRLVHKRCAIQSRLAVSTWQLLKCFSL